MNIKSTKMIEDTPCIQVPLDMDGYPIKRRVDYYDPHGNKYEILGISLDFNSVIVKYADDNETFSMSPRLLTVTKPPISYDNCVLKVGNTVYHILNNKEYTISEFDYEYETRVAVCSDTKGEFLVIIFQLLL